MRNEDFSFFQNEEFQENLKKYERMVTCGENTYLDAETLTDIAEYYIFHNEPSKAEECINYALTLHPDSVDPLIFKARQCMMEEDGLNRAISLCNLISNQNDREVVFLKGELMLRKNGETEADDFFHKEAQKLQDDPEEMEMFINDVSYIFQDYGFLEIAMKWAKRVTELDPKHVRGRAHQCELLMGMGNHKEAVKRLESYLDENPYSVKLWNLLANNYVLEERLNDAIEAADFSLAINDTSNPWALMIKIRAFFYLENYEKSHELSLDYFRKYGNFEAHSLLYDGLSLIQLGKYEEAISQLQRIEDSSLDEEELQQVSLQLSSAYCMLKQSDKAISYLEKAYTDVYPAEGYYFQKGYIYLNCGESDKALECLQHAKLVPSQELMIAAMLFENKEYEQALQRLLYVEESGDENTRKATYPYTSYCYKMLGNRQKFLDYLKKACEEVPLIAKNAIGSFFPNLEPDQYYDYACSHD